MYPEPDARADQLDEALERRRSGSHEPIADEELLELVQLASRLDRELPGDLPDPAFRESLRSQVLQGDVYYFPGSQDEPVDLAAERWHRRLLVSPWRVSAAAAACLVVIMVAFVAADGPFSGGSDSGSEDVTSFQPVDSDGFDGSSDSSQLPLDRGDDAPFPERWFTASFPPFDVEHMVLPPMLIGFLPLSERRKPRVELLGMAEMVEGVDMPETATVYYFNSPPDPGSMLTALQSALGVDGELIPGNGDGEPYRIVDQDQNNIMRWDATSAFFHFQGDMLDEPIGGLLDEGASHSEIAQRFLELIGFDLHTMEYERRVVQNGNGSEIQFRPEEMPETGLSVTLGGSVFVGENGEILEAQLYWLSLVDADVVQLRDAEGILDEIEHGNGFTPPVSDDSEQMTIEIDDMKFVHVLTRLGESNFVLQPAVKLLGDYGNDTVSDFPGPARFLVPAADSGD